MLGGVQKVLGFPGELDRSLGELAWAAKLAGKTAVRAVDVACEKATVEIDGGNKSSRIMHLFAAARRGEIS